MTARKKTTSTKKSTAKKASSAKKAPASRKTFSSGGTSKPTKTSVKKSVTKKSTSSSAKAPAEAIKEKLKANARQKKQSSDTSAKSKSRPIAFSFSEAEDIVKKFSGSKEKATPARKSQSAASTPAPAPAQSARENPPELDMPVEKKAHQAASLADILGFNPQDGSAQPSREKEVPKKYAKYYKLLLELREHVQNELDLHTKETLKRSNKEDTGDLSSYSQHMADAGTDTFDRDFALNLVSTEQEALSEIDAAIDRIFKGTYGICEINGQPINRDRLAAVPFTRFSLEGQAEYEKTNRRSQNRGGTFSTDLGGDAAQFLGEDND